MVTGRLTNFQTPKICTMLVVVIGKHGGSAPIISNWFDWLQVQIPKDQSMNKTNSQRN